MKNISLTTLLILVVFFTCQSVFAQEEWTKVANGLEYQNLSFSDGSPIKKELFVAKIVTNRHRVKVLRAQDFGKKSMSAREICLTSGALLCINASFFDEKDSALGLLISSGISFQKPHLGGETLTGIFASTRKAFSIIGRSELNSALFIEAIQAGPRLVTEGRKVSEIKDPEVSRRSGVCIDNSGAPVFFVSAVDSRAISLGEFANAMLKIDPSCKDGLNLDGGGSAQLFMRSENEKVGLSSEVIFDIRGEDEAPVFLGVVEGLKF